MSIYIDENEIGNLSSDRLLISIDGEDEYLNYFLTINGKEVQCLSLEKKFENKYSKGDLVIIKSFLIEEDYNYDISLIYQGDNGNNSIFIFKNKCELEELWKNLKILPTLTKDDFLLEKRFEDLGYYKISKLSPDNKKIPKSSYLNLFYTLVFVFLFVSLLFHWYNTNVEQSYSKVVSKVLKKQGNTSLFKIGDVIKKGEKIILYPIINKSLIKKLEIKKELIHHIEAEELRLEKSISTLLKDENSYKKSFDKRKGLFKKIITTKDKKGNLIYPNSERLKAVLGKLDYEIFVDEFAIKIQKIYTELLRVQSKKADYMVDIKSIENKIELNSFTFDKDLTVYHIYGDTIEFIYDKPLVYTLVQLNLNLPTKYNKAYFTFKHNSNDERLPCKLKEANRNEKITGGFSKEKLESLKFKLYSCIPENDLKEDSIGKYLGVYLTLDRAPYDIFSFRYEMYNNLKDNFGKNFYFYLLLV